MKLKHIEITTIRIVFDDDEPKEVKRIIKVQKNEEPEVKSKPEQKKRPSRCMFNEEQKAEIIRRYQAGEGPKAIAVSLGCAKSTIQHLINRSGVTEGRTGQHLKKQKPEPQTEDDDKEPVCNGSDETYPICC